MAVVSASSPVARVHAASTEYLQVDVSGPDAGDLTAGDLRVAFDLPGGALSASAVWHDVERYTPPASAAVAGVALLLVGPGSDVTLSAGLHRVYVDVASDPERPVQLAGRVYVED